MLKYFKIIEVFTFTILPITICFYWITLILGFMFNNLYKNCYRKLLPMACKPRGQGNCVNIANKNLIIAKLSKIM